MRVTGGREFKTWQGLVASGLTGVALLTSSFITPNKKSADALVYTVMVFSFVVLALRPAWRRLAFWRNLVLVFILHVLAIILIIAALPPGPRGLPWLFLTAAGMAEMVLLICVLWKRAARSREHRQVG